MTLDDVQKAITMIQESKKTHEDWLVYLQQNPGAGRLMAAQEEVAGNVEQQQRCIQKYNHVLDVLNSYLELCKLDSDSTNADIITENPDGTYQIPNQYTYHWRS